ncbi:unnamed protein product [Closterium sp. NIES-65]|nr:unnamed protein product [Closterium sp. NIES-65]
MRSNGPHDGALTPRLKSSPRGSSRPRDTVTGASVVSSRTSTNSSAVVIDERGGSSDSSLINIGDSGDSSVSVSVRPSAGLAGVTRHAGEALVELQVREGGDDVKPEIDGVSCSADDDSLCERGGGEGEVGGEEDVRPLIELPERHGLGFGERHVVGLSERHGSSAYSSARETDSEIDEASDGGRGRAGERRAGRVRERRVERSRSGEEMGARNWLAAAVGAASGATAAGSVTGGAMTGAGGGGSVKASAGWGGVRVRVWCDPRSLWPVARVLALLLLWYTFSTALSLRPEGHLSSLLPPPPTPIRYNKMLIGQQHGRFPAPLLLTAFHFAQQALMASALLHSAFPSALPPLPLSSRDYCLRVIPTAVATAVDIALSNQSLAYITLTFYTMCKSSAPMFLLLFAFIFRACLSLPACPSLLVPPCLSLPACPSLLVPPCLSLPACPSLLVPPCLSLPACPSLLVPPCLSLPACPSLLVPPCLSLPACPSLLVPPCLSLPACPSLLRVALSSEAFRFDAFYSFLKEVQSCQMASLYCKGRARVFLLLCLCFRSTHNVLHVSPCCTALPMPCPHATLCHAHATGGRLEPISFRLIGVMMVISVGVLFTVAGEASFHLWGFVLVMLSAMASGLRWVLIQVLLQCLFCPPHCPPHCPSHCPPHHPRHGLCQAHPLVSQKDRLGLSSPLVSLAYITPPMAVTCGLFSLALEPLASLPSSSYFSPPSHLAPTMLLLLLGGVLAFLMVNLRQFAAAARLRPLCSLIPAAAALHALQIMSEFLLILHTSAVTFSVAGTVKEGATILLSHQAPALLHAYFQLRPSPLHHQVSHLVFSDRFTRVNLVSVLIIMVGVSLSRPTTCNPPRSPPSPSYAQVSHLVFSDRFTRVNLVGVLIIMVGVSLFNLHR